MTRELGKRVVEALLFAAEEPLPLATIQAHLEGGLYADDLLRDLAGDYAGRGVVLERQGNAYAFRTAPDLAPHLAREQVQRRRLTKAGLETLAIIAYHQPVTRAEIEDIRGVSVSKGTLDVLLETGWVQPKGRRDAPRRPVTWVTTAPFLDHFGLASLDDLPRVEELLHAGLLSLAPHTSAEDETGSRDDYPTGDDVPADDEPRPDENPLDEASADECEGPRLDRP
ncbi:MAG: SMC-Scp complex subunit ScpB [Geminicoccaceae bacterium]|nr:SMC-Scp complex subunit ScpB [Geminicoccaceae bacterium]